MEDPLWKDGKIYCELCWKNKVHKVSIFQLRPMQVEIYSYSILHSFDSGDGLINERQSVRLANCIVVSVRKQPTTDESNR